MTEEYDLKKSEKGIGQLYPVLKDKNGNVIDGFHRLDDDPNWRTETLEHIDSEEKLLVARAVANWNRRQVSREEKEKWINGLAEIYRGQGYKIRGKQQFFEDGHTTSNEILYKISEVTGLSRGVGTYLAPEYKQTEQSRSYQPPRLSASERIEHTLGEEYVERHRKEVLEEEKLSPEEKAKLEAERQQRQEEKKRKDEETKQKRAEQTRLKAIKSALSKIEKTKKLGLDTSEFEDRIEQIKTHTVNDPDIAYEETKSLKKDLDTAINKEKKRKEEEKRKQHEEEIRRQAEEQTKQNILKDKEFLQQASTLATQVLNKTPEILKDPLKPETLEDDTQILEQKGLNTSIDNWLKNYENAIRNLTPEDFEQTPEQKKQLINETISRLIKRHGFACPICGNTKIFRGCGHDL